MKVAQMLCISNLLGSFKKRSDENGTENSLETILCFEKTVLSPQNDLDRGSILGVFRNRVRVG
jgi:hypothetical protein